jgi:hypothetical protein
MNFRQFQNGKLSLTPVNIGLDFVYRPVETAAKSGNWHHANFRLNEFRFTAQNGIRTFAAPNDCF